MLRVCCRVIKLCVSLGFPCSLETPQTSHMFLCPKLRRLKGRVRTQHYVLCLGDKVAEGHHFLGVVVSVFEVERAVLWFSGWPLHFHKPQNAPEKCPGGMRGIRVAQP